MDKPHVTRSFGPIHFEDLDPHRFEDLVRQLVYDLKQWQSIESTGRGGADDGFDVRAYEELQVPAILDEEDEDERPHPMEGNLWMIQCKREKQLGAKRIEEIIDDGVNADNPPFGYILAASANFSKAAHDKFREELRSRGVMEFYLWGAGELEDMLYQPKNDHILFAFFGISLVSRRRSRTTDIRSSVNIKNKLRRVLGDNPNHGTILVRNLQDTHYPYESEYNDFDKKPRWKAYSTTQFHPLGLIVSVARSYAYFDKSKKEWDFAKVNNILPQRGHYQEDHNDEKRKQWIAAKGFWEQLPHENKTTFVYDGLIRFDSIALVDDKGDVNFEFPHIFVDFREDSPFAGWFEQLEPNKYEHMSLEGLKQIDIFPDKFSTPKFGKIYKNKYILVDDGTVMMFRSNTDQITLYDFDNKYGYLKPTDVIALDKSEDKRDDEKLLKITNVRSIKGKALTQARKNDTWLNNEIERQISRKFKSTDTIPIIEAVLINDWQVEQNLPVIL